MVKENAEIVEQLRSIKKWVAVGAIGFVIAGIGITLFSASMVQLVSVFEEENSGKECETENCKFSWDSANELFEQGKTNELLKFVKKRLKTHPNDPTAHWFKAKVHYLNKEWSLAIESIEETETFAPSWRSEYTIPLTEKINELRK